MLFPHLIRLHTSAIASLLRVRQSHLDASSGESLVVVTYTLHYGFHSHRVRELVIQPTDLFRA